MKAISLRLSQPTWTVIFLLLGGLLVRGAIAWVFPPGFDEAYYYLYTQHLDWSYFDHPLLVAVSTGLGVWLTGEVSQFTLRWGALLLHTGALLLLYLTATRLFSQRAALITLAIATLAPIFLIGFGVLTLPDAPLIFFWTATLYVASCEFFPLSPSFQKYSNTSTPETIDSPSLPPFYQPTWRLALIGLLVGFACLSKYHGAALGVGLLCFCLTSPRHRVALISPWIVLSLGLFLLAIAPILIWNIQHDWVSLRFQSGRAVPDRGYSLLDLLVVFLAGVAYLFPTFGFPLWWVSWQTVREQGDKRDKGDKGDKRDKADGRSSPSSLSSESSDLLQKQRFILWLSLPLMLGFTLMGGYRAILPTWAAPGFWSATLLLGERAAGWARKSVRRWLWGSGWAIATILLIALLHLSLGIFQKPGRYALFGGFIPVNTDASTQQMDIQQLRQGLATAAVLDQGDFLFTNDIYLAGQMGMAIAPLSRKAVTCFDPDPRGFAFWSTPEQWVGQDGLLVTMQPQAEKAIAQYRNYFSQMQKLADIPIQRGGEIVQVIQIYQAKTLLKPYPRPY